MSTRQPTSRTATIGTSVPAVASRGVRHLLDGPRKPGVLLGASSNAAWVQAGGHVLVLSGPGAIRLPNGVTVAEPTGVVGCGPGDRCLVGDGVLEIGSVKASVVRWWDPRPTLTPTATDVVLSKCAAARRCFRCPEDEGLCDALQKNDPAAVRHAMCALLGKGEGLTPEGDDVLVGMLAGLRLLGPVVGKPGAGGMLAAVAPIVLTEAPFRTTALSAALLRHAVAGEVADPIAAFLHSLTGRGDLDEAVAVLGTMGNTSGLAAGCGVLAAAEYLEKVND
jgi:hypothetical protein